MAAVRESSKLRIFISYSRQDVATADALVEALTSRGFEVTIDRRDLPFGEKWQEELAEFIRLSDTVIWLVSDASINSPWVNWELDEVSRRNKRLIPVIVADTPRDKLPRQLGEIHMLPAEGVFEIERHIDVLVRVLDTDRSWLKEASRLQDRAAEWLAKGRNSALLLSRGALAEAERWKDRRPTRAPAPAQEVLDLLFVSRRATIRRQRWYLGLSFILTIGALLLSGFAYQQRNTAVQERDQALTTQSRFLADLAQQASRLYDHGKAALLALEALPDTTINANRPNVPEAELQLGQALQDILEQGILSGHCEEGNYGSQGCGVGRIEFNRDGSRLLSTGEAFLSP